jgi:hypothetical protein
MSLETGGHAEKLEFSDERIAVFSAESFCTTRPLPVSKSAALPRCQGQAERWLRRESDELEMAAKLEVLEAMERA